MRLPWLPEQEAIVAHVHNETSGLSALFGKVEEQIERLAEYRRALVSGAVTGRLEVENG